MSATEVAVVVGGAPPVPRCGRAGREEDRDRDDVAGDPRRGITRSPSTEPARAVAEQVGTPRVPADVLPQDRAVQVRSLPDEGTLVAMVGDGIDDAPAPGRADVGVAIGTGTDVAIRAADVTLVLGRLRGPVTALALPRATTRNTRRNLVPPLTSDAAAHPIAAGVLRPLTGAPLPPTAVAAVAATSPSVVLNARRLSGFTAPQIADRITGAGR